MTPSEALSYASGTVLGTQIGEMQALYRSAQREGAPESFLSPLMTILGNLISLNEQLIAYDKEVAAFQSKCTAIVKGVGQPGSTPGVSPMTATVIGLGSAGVGGILGFAAAKMMGPKPDEEEAEA
jgi:hypothetical protein